MEYNGKLFVERLVEVAGKKQADIAKDLNITPESISRWKKKMPTFDHLINILNLYNCSADYLLGLSGLSEDAKSNEDNAHTKSLSEFLHDLMLFHYYSCIPLQFGDFYTTGESDKKFFELLKYSFPNKVPGHYVDLSFFIPDRYKYADCIGNMLEEFETVARAAKICKSDKYFDGMLPILENDYKDMVDSIESQFQQMRATKDE